MTHCKRSDLFFKQSERHQMLNVFFFLFFFKSETIRIMVPCANVFVIWRKSWGNLTAGIFIVSVYKFMLCDCESHHLRSSKFQLFSLWLIHVCIYCPTSPLGQFLSGVKLIWNQFSFFSTECLTQARGLSLSYYLLILERRTDGFMPFPGAFVRNETQYRQGFELGSSIPFHTIIAVIITHVILPSSLSNPFSLLLPHPSLSLPYISWEGLFY